MVYVILYCPMACKASTRLRITQASTSSPLLRIEALKRKHIEVRRLRNKRLEPYRSRLVGGMQFGNLVRRLSQATWNNFNVGRRITVW